MPLGVATHVVGGAVDVIGVGSGVADILRTHKSLEVIDVNVGESANVIIQGQPEYNRLRDQLWFGLKTWIKNGGALPDDGKLHAELLAPMYGFTVDGRLKVESKDDIKKRLKRSPDRADAMALACYPGPGKVTFGALPFKPAPPTFSNAAPKSDDWEE